MGLEKKSWGWGKQNQVLLGQGWEAARGSAVPFVSVGDLSILVLY